MGGLRRLSQTVGATHHESKPLRTKSLAGATHRAAADRMHNKVSHKQDTCDHAVIETVTRLDKRHLCAFLLQLCKANVTCEVMPQSTRCCSSSLSWWARTFSTILRIFRGGLGKYSNQRWHQFTGQTNRHTYAWQRTKRSSPKNTTCYEEQRCVLLKKNSTCLQLSSTYNSGYDLKTGQWVVLEELDEWKGYQWKVLHLCKDGCPVS